MLHREPCLHCAYLCVSILDTGLRSVLERHLIGLPRLNVCRSCDNCCRITDVNTLSASIRGSHWARVSVSIGMFDHIVLLQVMPLLQSLPACSRLFFIDVFARMKGTGWIAQPQLRPCIPRDNPHCMRCDYAIAICVSMVSSYYWEEGTEGWLCDLWGLHLKPISTMLLWKTIFLYIRYHSSN